MRSPSQADSRLPLSTAIIFASAALPLGALVTAILIYLPAHLTGHLGVPLAVVGGAWAATRLLDIGSDLALGLAMDRTTTRFGRYRLWLGLGTPVMMLGVAMTFFAPPGIGLGYLVCWLTVLYVGLSIHDQAHAAWSATLATSYHQRSWLSALIVSLGTAATLCVLALPALAELVHASQAAAVRAMGWLIIAAAPLAIGAALWRVPERVSPRHRADPPRLSDFKDLVLHPDLMRLAVARIALQLGPYCLNSLYLFFANDYLRLSTAQASGLLAVYGVAGLPGASLAAWVSTRLGKARTVAAGAAVYALILPCTLLLPKGSMAAAAPLFVLAGLVSVAFDAIVPSMMADVADEIRLVQGRERLSLIYAVNTIGRKIAGALAIGLTFTVLQALGYSPEAGAANRPEAIRNLAWMFAGAPAAFTLLGGLSLLGWRLDAARHAGIRAELDLRDRRAHAASEPGDPSGVVSEAPPGPGGRATPRPTPGRPHPAVGGK